MLQILEKKSLLPQPEQSKNIDPAERNTLPGIWLNRKGKKYNAIINKTNKFKKKNKRQWLMMEDSM